ncbi:MAG: DinB family protein [Planctomycetes bacterium]|nr:DinB family protein [Planctomycetota bacterium]
MESSAMGRIGSIIAAGAKLGVMYAERLLADVTPDACGRFASPGGVTIRSNHPAFILGHLSLYPIRIMQNLKLPTGPTAFPPQYETLFKFGVECQDDPQGKTYPLLDELKTRFFDGYRAAIAAVESASDEAFDAPNPAEGRLRELFPTVGSAINFYLIGHVQVHLGQFSAWRRAMGLPPA